ncbi:LytS/YhcK type 5TM receptor domain-containing protein [Desulfosporosinus hippei]|uniref:histidine kinase n=1 Tax=Desulfosporosinus hippei DSM 8344 TaxID=1121419 RepID=A0A1G8FFU1_9FIRM|nr:LytS/YhcK type 5TM receptor domain-containing protein [Desulfosporosinus hippei]SDH80902.1 two-component system, LytT family, sensor histidine kinase LytS [Desulfosporosinus hippei DSM 8344]
MNITLFKQMALDTSFLVTIAYLLSLTPLFKKTMRGMINTRERIILILIFGIIGIVGTYMSLPTKGALANSRVVGVVAGGLLGGPVIGLGSGIIAGTHRYFLGGATSLSCAIATIINGLIAGLLAKNSSSKLLSWKQTVLIGFGSEILEMLMILATLPAPDGWDVVKTMGPPMIIMNGIGIAIFYGIAQNSILEEERIGALQAQKALYIANLTLPILRLGLSEETAEKVCEIIFKRADFAAVAITSDQRVLAHVGKGSDHHTAGLELQTKATIEAISTGEIKLAVNKEEIGCSDNSCCLGSALIVPLRFEKTVVGTLKIYRQGKRSLTKVDREFAAGLGQLFSTQLELAALETRASLVSKAELKALQAQINPHFLFNAINTIVSFCRTNPRRARDLLLELGDFFRKNLQSGDRFVSLREECDHIRAYLAIEQARFSDRLNVIEEISEEVLNWQIPGLTLQPLIENAIKHGIYPLNSGGQIIVSAEQEKGFLLLKITDNGVGIPNEKLKLLHSGETVQSKGLGIGLKNVEQRLKYAYHGQADFMITSVFGRGTVVTLRIPEKPHFEIA